MPNILYISSSLSGEQGHSSQMAQEFIAGRRAQGESINVIHRDLHAQALPHLDAQRFAALTTAPENRSAEQSAIAEQSDALIAEVRNADEIVIAMPLYNLGVPSTFKAWIDHIARAGETFRYTENGPQGLLHDRPVHIFAARGGQYVGTAMDTQSPYLRHIFGLMGIESIHFIYAEGLNMGPETADQARQHAREAMFKHAS
ncbi:FMN-dependent NADH-azoreductase [Spongiibacter marinus]|jgi:FMN-dependent NADH-azoreductase|uniref:FMN-dependent NADH-azoreductase n=1 Tax=Spongiibacter marinus TaxID=354246 RepID=UPI003C6162E7